MGVSRARDNFDPFTGDLDESPALWTPSQLALRWRVDVSTITRKAKAGDLPGAMRLPGGSWRIPRQTIIEAEGRVASKPVKRSSPRRTSTSDEPNLLGI